MLVAVEVPVVRRRAIPLVAAAALVVAALIGPPAPAQASRLDLHRGSRGAVVKTLEKRLHTLRLLPRRAVNRRFTTRTTRAVRAFQRSHELLVTGRVRNPDWDAIAAAVQPPAPAPPPPVLWTAPAWAAPRVVGHRGTGIGSPPENSVAAWSLAASTADVLDVDVRWTADRQMLVIHDARLDRTTNCSGEVATWTAQAIADSCRLGDGSPVPTFADAVGFARDQGMSIAPEIKTSDLGSTELADFVAVLHSRDMDARAFVQSFLPEYFSTLTGLDPALRLVYLTGGTTVPGTETVEAAGAQVVGAKLGTVDAAQVAAWQQAGLEVWLWTSRDLAALQETWSLHADAAVTDLPAEARSLYGARR